MVGCKMCVRMGGEHSTFGTNPHLLSDFEVKVDKIHFWSKKSTLALFSAIQGLKVDFDFWHLNPLIHYFEKILGSKWKKSTFGTFKIFEKNFGQFSRVHLFSGLGTWKWILSNWIHFLRASDLIPKVEKIHFRELIHYFERFLGEKWTKSTWIH